MRGRQRQRSTTSNTRYTSSSTSTRSSNRHRGRLGRPQSPYVLLPTPAQKGQSPQNTRLSTRLQVRSFNKHTIHPRRPHRTGGVKISVPMRLNMTKTGMILPLLSISKLSRTILKATSITRTRVQTSTTLVNRLSTLFPNRTTRSLTIHRQIRILLRRVTSRPVQLSPVITNMSITIRFGHRIIPTFKHVRTRNMLPGRHTRNHVRILRRRPSSIPQSPFIRSLTGRPPMLHQPHKTQNSHIPNLAMRRTSTLPTNNTPTIIFNALRLQKVSTFSSKSRLRRINTRLVTRVPMSLGPVLLIHIICHTRSVTARTNLARSIPATGRRHVHTTTNTIRPMNIIV